jgi:hypothetical protein
VPNRILWKPSRYVEQHISEYRFLDLYAPSRLMMPSIFSKVLDARTSRIAWIYRPLEDILNIGVALATCTEASWKTVPWSQSRQRGSSTRTTLKYHSWYLLIYLILAVKLRLVQDVCRELHTWSKCQHANVLMLLGLAKFRDQLGMISRWMKNGNIPWYLRQHPEVDRCRLVRFLVPPGYLSPGL